MFLPGSECGCCEPCNPCPYCFPSCLLLTFSGFSHGTGNCNECDYLDDGTYLLKRPVPFGWVYPSVSSGGGSGATFGTIGVNSLQTPINMARREDGSYYVTAIPINQAGSGYEEPQLSFTASGQNFIQCRPPSVEITTNESGGIASVVVTDGGEYWPNNSCRYTTTVCQVCPDAGGRKMAIVFTITETEYELEVFELFGSFAGSSILHATRPVVDENGDPVPCDQVTFSPEHFSEGLSCLNTGTVSVSSGDCSIESVNGCDLPESISLTISGIGDVFVWSSQNGGSPGMAYCDTNGDGVFDESDASAESGGWGNIFCGQCDAPQDGVRIQSGGVSAGPAGYFVALAHRNETAVLDRVPNSCGIEYTGQLSGLPFATGSVVTGLVGVNCGEGSPRYISVLISPAGLETTVSIDGPTNDGEAATLEATAVNSTGGLTAITVLTPGSGYAREIFDRVEPTVTAESTSSGGTDAVLAVSLTQYGTGEEAFWSVDSVSVTSGGTGYTGQEMLDFSVAAGDTQAYPAFGVIVTGREEPTVTADASGGSGADLTVNLVEGVDWNGAAIWSVQSVTVVDGGSGYPDSGSVAFTATDGVEVWPASASFQSGRVQPQLTASVSSSTGSGASLSVTLQAGYSNDWAVSAVSIDAAGSGYVQGDQVLFLTGDTEGYAAYAYVSSVDASGAITGIGIYDGGSYWESTGEIVSVSFDYYGGGGEYYKSSGSIESVTLYDGGSYYRLEPTGQVAVDEPGISIASVIGTNAAASAVIDDDPESVTFGQVLSITIDQAGENYRLGGTGWKATINAELTHRAGECLVSPADFVGPCADENESCPGFSSYALPMAERVTAEPCPTDLLSKTYLMAFERLTRFNGDIANADEATFCFSGYYGNRLVIVDFGQGDIECTLGPA